MLVSLFIAKYRAKGTWWQRVKEKAPPISLEVDYHSQQKLDLVSPWWVKPPPVRLIAFLNIRKKSTLLTQGAAEVSKKSKASFTLVVSPVLSIAGGWADQPGSRSVPCGISKQRSLWHSLEIKEMCCWLIKNSAHWTGQGRDILKSDKLLVELELGLDIELRSSPDFRRLLRLSSV